MSPDGLCVKRDPGLSPSLWDLPRDVAVGSPDATRMSLCVWIVETWRFCVCPYKNEGNDAKETLSMASPLRDNPEMLNEI